MSCLEKRVDDVLVFKGLLVRSIKELVLFWPSHGLLTASNLISNKFIQVLFQVITWWSVHVQARLVGLVLDVHRGVFLLLGRGVTRGSFKIDLWHVVGDVDLGDWRIDSFFYWRLGRVSEHDAGRGWLEMLVCSPFDSQLRLDDFWGSRVDGVKLFILVAAGWGERDLAAVKRVLIEVQLLQWDCL